MRLQQLLTVATRLPWQDLRHFLLLLLQLLLLCLQLTNQPLPEGSLLPPPPPHKMEEVMMLTLMVEVDVPERSEWTNTLSLVAIEESMELAFHGNCHLLAE